MKIGIAFIGSRGIPAKYGGNEVLVEEVSSKLSPSKFNIIVACESNRFLIDNYRENILRVHIPAIKSKLTTIPAVNDLFATVYLIIRFGSAIDVFYYVAPDGSLSAILPRLLGKFVVVNTDGIEWKRPMKRRPFWPLYLRLLSPLVRSLLLFLEYLSVKISNIVIADSLCIEKYLEQRYRAKNVIYIPYGARKLLPADLPKIEEEIILKKFKLNKDGYFLTVARAVAENNIHLEILGFKMSESRKNLVLVGNFHIKDPYIRFLHNISRDNRSIIFLNPIYNKIILGILRKNCFAYIHPYEVGGTNPSLVEQMQFGKPILAYDVPFNREVLGPAGIYFKNSENLAFEINLLEKGKFDLKTIKESMIQRVNKQYNWETITIKYEKLFELLRRRYERSLCYNTGI